jgi:hypothetical protein
MILSKPKSILGDYLFYKGSPMNPPKEKEMESPIRIKSLSIPFSYKVEILIKDYLTLVERRQGDVTGAFAHVVILDGILSSIPVYQRELVLHKLFTMEKQFPEIYYLDCILLYFKKCITLIDFEGIKKRTLKNILKTNEKEIIYFLDHNFDYRPQEIIPKVEEQIYIPNPFSSDTLDNINECVTSLEEAAETITETVKRSDIFMDFATEKLSEASDQMSGLSDLIPSFIATLNAVKTVSDKGTETLTSFNSVTQSSKSFSNRIQEHWIAIIACITGITKSTNYTGLFTHLIPLLSMLGFESGVIDFIKTSFMGKQSLSEQSGFDSTKKLMCFLASLLGKYSPISFLAKFTATSATTMKELDSLKEVISMIEDVLAEFGFDISSKAKAIRALQEDMISIIEVTPRFETLLATKGATFMNDKLYKEFMTTYNKLQTVKKQVDTGVYMSIRNSNFCSDLMNFNTRYIRMKAQIDAVRATNGRRQEPLALLFHGPPGIGKSQMIDYIIARTKSLYHSDYAELEEYDVLDDISDWTTWAQCTSDDYHQGYSGQEIHVVDDLFSKTDHIDHRDMLQFISCTVFPTRQAELSEKGKPYISKLILASSNIFPTSSKVLNAIDALHRRFVVIDCTLKDGRRPPSSNENYDTTFDWLNIYGYTGKGFTKNMDHRQQFRSSHSLPLESTKSWTIDMICHYIIKGIKAKADIFNSAMAACQDDTDIVEFSHVSATNEVIYMDDTWTGTLARYRQNPIIYKFLRKLSFKYIDLEHGNITEKVYKISDLIGFNPLFEDSRHILINANDLVNPSTTNYLLVMHEENSESHLAYDFETHRVKRIIDKLEFPDMFEREYDPWQNWEESSTFEKFQRYFINYYTKVYTSFGPLIKMTSFTLGMVNCVVNPVIQLAMNIMGIIIATLKSKGSISDFTYMVWDATADLVAITSIIPILIGVIGMIIYKCKSFTMTEPCRNCAYNILNMDELHKKYCNQMCRYMVVGQHLELCEEFLEFSSYLFRDSCVPCETQSCLGTCSHSIPINVVDYKKLAHYKWWYTTYVDMDIADEEVSPSGEKMTKVKRRFPTTSKLRHELKEWIEEQSPQGEKLLKVKRVFPKSKIKEEYDNIGHTPGSKEKPQIKVSFIEKGFEQATSDPNAKELYANLTTSSLKVYRTTKGRESSLYGHPFGKYLVTPAHLHDSSDLNAKYYFYTTKDNVELKIEIILVAKKVLRDVALWTFTDKRVQFSEKFLKNLISEDEYVKIANQTTYVLQHLPQSGLTQLVTAKPVLHKLLSISTKGTQKYEKLFEVKATQTLAPLTSAGDCGGLLIAYNTLITRKVLGFHILGSETTGYSAIVTKELVESLLPSIVQEESNDYTIIDSKYTKYPLVDIMNQVNHIVGKPTNLPKGEFEYIGELGYVARPAAKTGLRQHPLYGTFGITAKPANLNTPSVEEHLKDELDVDPTGRPNLLITRTKKYGKKFVKIIDTEILENMKDQLLYYFKEQFRDKDIGMSTNKEILNGNMLDIDSHPLDMRTSAGIPWAGTESHHAFKKNHFIKMIEEGNDLIREFDLTKLETIKLFDILGTTERLAIQGYRTVSINKDCIKDECRPLNKVHKPRIFKNVPFDKVILMKRYLGRFKTEWTKLRGLMFHAVGIDCVSVEWADLYHSLKSYSEIGCDADFGSFDGNLRPEFMDLACDLIRKTIFEYTQNEDQDKIIQVLLDENVRSLSVSASTVYMDNHGNPSGSPMTTVLNCIVNFLYHWYAFIRITKYEGLSKFLDKITLRCFGDDVIFTADRELNYVFDSVAKIMIDELEQDYTDASKSKFGATKPIEELTFLKRTFKYVSPSIVLAPIEKASIEQRFNYTQIKPTDNMTHKELLEEGFLEAVAHGPTYFGQFASSIQRGIRENHLNHLYGIVNPKYTDYHHDLIKRYS